MDHDAIADQILAAIDAGRWTVADLIELADFLREVAEVLDR
jgi:hypothetical protein